MIGGSWGGAPPRSLKGSVGLLASRAPTCTLLGHLSRHLIFEAAVRDCREHSLFCGYLYMKVSVGSNEGPLNSSIRRCEGIDHVLLKDEETLKRSQVFFVAGRCSMHCKSSWLPRQNSKTFQTRVNLTSWFREPLQGQRMQKQT